MGALFTSVLAILLVLLLVSAGIQDARTREIANWKNAAIAILALPWWFAIGLSPWPDMIIQLGVALIAFGLFVLAFYLGQMGGGDVKMIGALALWFPFQSLVWMLVVMSLLGGALTFVMLIDKWMRSRREIPEVPYGVAIAAAALLMMCEPNFYQFG